MASNLVTRKGERGDVNRANESEVETGAIESQDEREASEREQVHSVRTIECEWASNVQRVLSLYQGENGVLTPLPRTAAHNPWGIDSLSISSLLETRKRASMTPRSTIVSWPNPTCLTREKL